MEPPNLLAQCSIQDSLNGGGNHIPLSNIAVAAYLH
jgi:hypothetical protein